MQHKNRNPRLSNRNWWFGISAFAGYIFCRVLDIRVAQVVETDTLHLVCYQKIREMLAQEIGPNPLSHAICNSMLLLLH